MEVEQCDAICDHTRSYTLLHYLLSLSTGIVDLDSDHSVRDLSISPNIDPIRYYGQVVEVLKALEEWFEYTQTGVRPAPDDITQQPVCTLCIQKTIQYQERGAQLDDPSMARSRHLNSTIDLVASELIANYRESRAASNVVHVVVTRCTTNSEKKISQESAHKSRPTL